MQYKAFISYSHAADNMLAPTLQSSLQKFSKPFYKIRNFRIFRDKTTLNLTPKLWPLIQQSLKDSEYFIFLASPTAAESKWVTKEVNEWLSIHNNSLDKFLIVLTDGTISWSDTKQDFDWENTTALPLCLKEKFEHEPLYSDLRWAKKTTDLSLRHPQFIDEISSIASILLSRPKDAIVGEDVRQHRNFRRITYAAIALLLLLLSGSLAAAFIANQQRKIAKYQTTIAQRQERIADSQRLEATKQRIYADSQRKLVQVTADSLQVANKLAKERQVFAEQQQALAQKRQREAEYMLGENFIRQGNIPKGVALFAKVSKNFYDKQRVPEYSTALQYYIPRLSPFEESVKEYEKPIVVKWREGNYYVSKDGIPKFISNTIITNWSVNYNYTRLLTLEDNDNAVLRDLPSMRVIKNFSFSGYEINLVAENKKEKEFFLVGRYKAASMGTFWPLFVDFYYNGSTSSNPSDYDLDEDSTNRKRYDSASILEDTRASVIELPFPKYYAEANMWHSISSFDSSHLNTQEKNSQESNHFDSLYNSILSSLNNKHLVKSRNDKDFFDLLKNDKHSINSIIKYKYQNRNYLIGTTNSIRDMGQYGSHLFIFEIKNGKIIDYAFIEVAVEPGDLYPEDNLLYLGNNVYPTRDAFILFDFNTFRQLIPNVSPLIDGPDRNGFAYNNSKKIMALIPNYQSTLSESSDAEGDSTNSEYNTLNKNKEDTNDVNIVNNHFLSKENLSNNNQNIVDSLLVKNTDETERDEMETEEIEDDATQNQGSDLWIYRLDYTTSRMKRVWQNTMKSQINCFKFASDDLLVVTTNDNELSALDCKSLSTLWTINNPLNDTSDKVIKIETDGKTGVVAVFNKNKICLYLAKSGLPLSEIYTPSDTASKQVSEIENVWFSSNGDLQLQYGNKYFSRNSLYSKQKFNEIWHNIENTTGISSKDGLTEIKYFFNKK